MHGDRPDTDRHAFFNVSNTCLPCKTLLLYSSPLYQAIDRIRSACTGCGVCRTQCAFLQRYGTPRDIINRYDLFDRLLIAFECGLCNLCSTVCPERLDPGSLFLAMRREAIDRQHVDLTRYRPLLTYEKWGSSPLLSLNSLPKKCDTVFFPGCALPGTRPQTTWKLFDHLQQNNPQLGIVIDCCGKPSHDLGRQERTPDRTRVRRV